MGTHGGQPLQCLKDLFLFVVSRSPSRTGLGFVGQVGHPLLGEGSPDDIASQVLLGHLILGK